MKKAFTLSEVLITLGVIGVVAALTIPVIIQNYRKSVVETSVKRFYTTINQSIILSERENGDIHNWTGTPNYNGDGAQTWDKYFDKYVVTVKKMKSKDGENTIFVFPDGSGLRIKGQDYFYCVNANLFYKLDNLFSTPQCMLFGFYPNLNTSKYQACVVANYGDKGVEPYIHSGADCNKIDDAKYLCAQGWYAKALQINGWKFPKDCKVKF